jgi:tetratricopeptide (TPR) repeat protein
LDEVSETHARDPSLLLARGQLAAKEGRLPEAETWLRQAVASKPSFQPAYYALILCLNRQGKSDDADKCQQQLRNVEADLRELDKLVHRLNGEPGNPQLRYEIARLLLRIGEEKEGENWLLMTLRLNPNHAAARQALAERSQPRASKPGSEDAGKQLPAPNSLEMPSIGAGLAPKSH